LQHHSGLLSLILLCSRMGALSSQPSQTGNDSTEWILAARKQACLCAQTVFHRDLVTANQSWKTTACLFFYAVSETENNSCIFKDSKTPTKRKQCWTKQKNNSFFSVQLFTCKKQNLMNLGTQRITYDFLFWFFLFVCFLASVVVVIFWFWILSWELHVSLSIWFWDRVSVHSSGWLETQNSPCKPCWAQLKDVYLSWPPNCCIGRSATPLSVIFFFILANQYLLFLKLLL